VRVVDVDRIKAELDQVLEELEEMGLFQRRGSIIGPTPAFTMLHDAMTRVLLSHGSRNYEDPAELYATAGLLVVIYVKGDWVSYEDGFRFFRFFYSYYKSRQKVAWGEA